MSVSPTGTRVHQSRNVPVLCMVVTGARKSARHRQKLGSEVYCVLSLGAPDPQGWESGGNPPWSLRNIWSSALLTQVALYKV